MFKLLVSLSFSGALLLAATLANAQAPTATSQGTLDETGTYTVFSGDTLFGIASRYGLRVAQITAANSMGEGAGLSVGQRLVIPGFQTATGIEVARSSTAVTLSGSGHLVEPGQTLYSIARLYGVSVAQLSAVNQITDPSQLRVGQTLQVPGQTAAAVPVAAPAATAPQTHTVERGQTLYAVARLYSLDVNTLSVANNITDPSQLRAGQVLQIPGSIGATLPTSAGVTTTDQPWDVTDPTSPVYLGAVGAVEVPANGTTAVQPTPVTPTPVVREAASNAVPVSTAPATPLMLPNPPPRRSSRFAWPARGKIETRFGDQGNGQSSDGIEIAVSPGSNILAAENGVVAFAGTGVSGYGYLVLIKHADDFYTAYAQNSGVTVKRGDVVDRGDLIARAGTSAIGTAGRLHFEVRHGDEPVNPVSHLAN